MINRVIHIQLSNKRNNKEQVGIITYCPIMRDQPSVWFRNIYNKKNKQKTMLSTNICDSAEKCLEMQRINLSETKILFVLYMTLALKLVFKMYSFWRHYIAGYDYWKMVFRLGTIIFC